MCDTECQAQMLAEAENSTAEGENIILLVTFFLLVTLVYLTGLIVWVWCNRNPQNGLSAVQQTDRLTFKTSHRAGTAHQGQYLKVGDG